ncbi:hypothetical protein DOT_3463 [Desulfosporosinus sp. OT]|nr:hypothetical protein DOT_3463 [Desulfosporosinus sp. OT]
MKYSKESGGAIKLTFNIYHFSDKMKLVNYYNRGNYFCGWPIVLVE